MFAVTCESELGPAVALLLPCCYITRCLRCVFLLVMDLGTSDIDFILLLKLEEIAPLVLTKEFRPIA